MRVLYIDGVGPFGGASRSLYEAIRAMPKGQVDPYFIAVRGSALRFYEEVATDVVAMPGLTRFDNTLYSHYRGVRWLVLSRELLHLPFTIVGILRARFRWKRVDVIHANEITEIIPLLMAKRVFRAPVVVHVRSVTWVDERSWRCRWLQARVREDMAAVVAIDENVRSTLPPDVPVDVIHNSFTREAAPRPDPLMVERLDSLRPTSLRVGFIGNLHHSKGLFDLLEAARLVRAAKRDVEFLIVGDVTRVQRGITSWLLDWLKLAQDVKADLVRRIQAQELEATFHLLGATSDIQCVYERIHVLCFPSHFDAPGRPIFEAAFSSVPCIAAVSDPRPDTLVPGATGLAVPPRDPEKLAEAILYFADHRAEVERMGANAKALAERNFDPRTNARKLLEVYSRVIKAASGPSSLASSHP